MVPDNLRYTKEHEWVKIEDKTAVIGISDYAQAELGDIVFVELPVTGSFLEKGDSPVVLESVKAVSSVYSPFKGEITEVNTKLDDEPELINSSPYEDGWIFKITITSLNNDDLMDSVEYQKYINELD